MAFIYIYVMEKKLLITKKIANHKDNKKLCLKVGENVEIEAAAAGENCPPDTAKGYYVRVSGNCVFVPYG